MPTSGTDKGAKNEVATRVADPDERAPGSAFVPCLAALTLLRRRLTRVSAEELAMWVFDGPESGGIAAYVAANELDPPPRFCFQTLPFAFTDNDPDFVAPLMACWFRRTAIEGFQPARRYITGHALRTRWSCDPDMSLEAFVYSKIAESRLHDIHPIFGLTKGTLRDSDSAPGWESGMFNLAEVEAIEATDLAGRGIGRPTNEQPAERSARLNRRAAQLQAAGVRDFNATIAEEENLSVSSIKQIRARAKPKQKAADWTSSLSSTVQKIRQK